MTNICIYAPVTSWNLVSSTSPPNQISKVNAVQYASSQQSRGKNKMKNKPKKSNNNNENPKTQTQPPALENKSQ
jgi:hypothetical protein